MMKYCGKNCLFAAINEKEALPLSASAREERAWLAGSKVVRAIAAGGHKPAHPLSREGLTLEGRRGLLEKLSAHPAAHVERVTAVCGCAFETGYVEGEPLRDFGLGPDANRLRHPDDRRPAWAPQVLSRLLADLSAGLRGLHEAGMIHGDAALMNAFVATEDGESRALWVDLNSLDQADAEGRAMEAAAFLMLTVWPALLECRVYSPSLLREALAACKEAGEPLAALEQAFRLERTDYREGDVRAEFLKLVRTYEPARRQDAFGRHLAALGTFMAPAYFLDQTVADLNGRFWNALVQAERARHRLYEEERTRLHYLRFQHEVDERERRVRESERRLEELKASRTAAAGAVEGLLKSRKHRLYALVNTVFWLAALASKKFLRFCLAPWAAAPRTELQLFLINSGLLIRCFLRGKSRTLTDSTFNTLYYSTRYSDVLRAGISPLMHYIFVGYAEGRDASESFCTRAYAARHADVAAAGLNPALHYALYGASEGRRPD